MIYHAIAIANYFVTKSFNHPEVEITPMKVIKMTYIAHGWHLALYDSPLIGEPVEAWKYGPVISSVYDAFKSFKNNRIKELGRNNLYTESTYPTIKEDDSETAEFLDTIWKLYKDFSGIQLSNMTHQENTPWDIAWNQSGGKNSQGHIVTNDIIKAHYLEKLQQ